MKLTKTKTLKIIYELSERLADEPDYDDIIAPQLESLADLVRGKEEIFEWENRDVS